MSLEFIPVDEIQAIARDYGYWAVFIGIALENMGIPLPGETITIAGGFLAGSGELNYWFVLLTAIAGAVLGDNFGYWIGRWGGWPFLVRVGRWFKFTDRQLIKARQQFSKNAPRAVFFGRFVALLRIFAGPMAGIAQMPYYQFLLCNFGGATVWATVTITVSFFLGRLMPLAQLVSLSSQFGLIVLAIAVLIIGGIIWLETYKKKLEVK
ncbi:MAG: DedA family protein [Microcystaceae cyanobacterium]